MRRRRLGAGAAALACVAGLLLGGCGRPAGTERQQVSGWASQSGIVALDETVAGDVSSIEGAFKAGKTLTARTVCDALYDDTSQAYVQLPSPDQQLTDLLDSAYEVLGQGANECSEGQTSQGLAALRTGSADSASADARLQSFGVATTGGTGATGTS